MKIGRRFYPFLFILSIAFVLPAFMAEAGEKFEGKGVAPIREYDLDYARTLAIKRANRAALEEALGSLISQRTYLARYDILNGNIISRPEKYIMSSTPLTEERVGDRYEIKVWAEVDTEAVRAKLVELNFLPPPESMPRWIVAAPSIRKGGPSQTRWRSPESKPSTAEKVLEKFINNYGYEVAKPAEELIPEKKCIDKPMSCVEEYRNYASRMGATHIMLGEARVSSGEALTRPGYVLGVAGVHLKALGVATGEMIGRASRRVALELPEGENLQEKLLPPVFSKLKPELQKWMDEVNPAAPAGFEEVRLKITGFVSYAEYSAILDVLEKELENVRRYTLESIARGQAQMKILYTGPPDKLVRKLVELEYRGFEMNYQGKTKDKHIVKVVQTPD